MELADFLALALATSLVVETWFHGSLFAEARAYVEVGVEVGTPLKEAEAAAEAGDTGSEGESAPLWMRIADRILPSWVCALLSCPFCFSHHVPYLLALICFLPAILVTSPWAVFLWKLPVYSLAATRLALLIPTYHDNELP